MHCKLRSLCRTSNPHTCNKNSGSLPCGGEPEYFLPIAVQTTYSVLRDRYLIDSSADFGKKIVLYIELALW